MMPFCTVNVHFSVVVNLEKRMRHIAFNIFLSFRKVDVIALELFKISDKAVSWIFCGTHRLQYHLFPRIPRVFLERFQVTQNRMEAGWNSVDRSDRNI